MASNDDINNTESCKNGKDEIAKIDNVEQDIISGEEVSNDPISEKEPTDNVHETPVASASAVFVPKFLYTDKQWSSLNKSGKNYYGIGLKQIKNDPLSKTKPNAPLIEACDVIKHPCGSLNVLQPANDILLPLNLKGGLGDLRNDSDLKEDGRKIAVAVSDKLGSTGGSNNSFEPVIRVSSREDAKLKLLDSVRTGTSLLRKNLSEEELRTQKLYKKFRSLLNELTPQKLDMLVKRILDLEIVNQKRMERVIDMLFEKALAKPKFSETYAKMCLKLSHIQVPSDINREYEVSFREVIINKCQTEFETGKTNERLMKLEKASAETAEPVKKKELQMKINKEKKNIKWRAVANIRFIGELFKLQMLNWEIMDYCIGHLIDPLEEENLECLCQLLTTIGEEVEKEGETLLDSIFKKMAEIVKNRSYNLSGRVKYMIHDVIDLRRRKWLVKSVFDSQPMMKDQIQKEAEQQQHHKDAAPMQERMTFSPISRPVSDTLVPTEGGLGGLRNDTPRDLKEDGKGSVDLLQIVDNNSSHRPVVQVSLASRDDGEMREDVKLKQTDSALTSTKVRENLSEEELKTQEKHTTNLKNLKSIKHTDIHLCNINKENIIIPPCSTKESLDSEKVKNMCVRLVTTHGWSLNMIQEAAFQEIVNIAVPSNAVSKEINSNFIRAMIPQKAYQIRSKIGADVRNKMVSLKLDSVTYLDRHFLGIHLQYIQNGKITIRNLAVLEVMERVTRESLKEKLIEILTDFKIASSQIYSITTDNGNNCKKITKLITQHCCETRAVDDIDEESSCDENEQSEDEEHIHYTEEELNVEDIASELSNGQFKPRAIFCVAHTLHLAVKDAIGHNVSVQMTINTARQAVNVLHHPNWKNLLRSTNLKKPTIDCPTRWNSTYLMLVRLHSIKDILAEQRELSINSEGFWAEIVDIIECLNPLHEATVALQREPLTISDFYIEWLNCRTKVEAMRTTFAGDLVKFMKKREKNLMDKDCVLESLYLDGRINIMLSDQECVKAKSLLCQTFRQLEIIASSEVGRSEKNIPSTSHYDENDKDNMSDLERMLQQTEKMRRQPQRVTENIFEESLNKLRFEPRLPLSKNIIAHWHSNEASASLQKVASCVLAAPATQVSVERLLSSVKFILKPIRTDIGGSLLHDIMLIRANHDLFE